MGACPNKMCRQASEIQAMLPTASFFDFLALNSRPNNRLRLLVKHWPYEAKDSL
jgi:hypothetical protein